MEMSAHCSSAINPEHIVVVEPRRGLSGKDRETQVQELLEKGEAQLLQIEADKRYEIHSRNITRGTIELTTTELSHLHSQLNSITMQCTLIIGFGLASIGADTLSSLASDDNQFCIFKSTKAMLFGTGYILLTTIAICMCMTIITCAQIITYESTRASFTYEHTKHVVQMTTILMHGDHRLKSDLPPGIKPIKRPFTIYGAFFVALICFFLCTVLVVWLFLGTDNWIRLPNQTGKQQAWVQQPPTGDGADNPPNGTEWNDYILYTNEEHYLVRCTNPYDSEVNWNFDDFGTLVSWLNSGAFFGCLLLGFAQARFVSQQYKPENLLATFEVRYDSLSTPRTTS